MEGVRDVTTSYSKDVGAEMLTLPWKEANRSATNHSIRTMADPSMPMIRFVCEVLVSFPVAIFGILGNILSFVVLCQQKKRLTTNFLLKALAFADTLILICSIVLRSMRHVGWETYDEIYHYVFVALYPFVYFFRLADTWITVLMTVDRYIAVCYPLKAQSLCTLRRTYVIVAVIVVTTFTVSMPRLFEFRLNDRGSGFILTKLVRNMTYTVVYRILFFFIVMYLVPMGTLLVLNIRLLRTLRNSHRKRDLMLSNVAARSKVELVGMSKSSRGVTLIVIALVIVCVVCNVIAMITHVFWALQVCFTRLLFLEKPRRFLANFNNIMITFNSAINFLIYCMCSRKFRLGVLEMFGCNRLRRLAITWRSDSKSSNSTAGNSSWASMIRLSERLSLKGKKGSVKSEDSSEI